MSSRRDPDLAQDLAAAVETRRELGEAYDQELVEAFVAKVDQRIDAVVDKRVRRRLAEHQAAGGGRGGAAGRPEFRGPSGPLGLALASLLLAIPLSAIAAAHVGPLGLVVAWAGIVGINACYAMSRRVDQQRALDGRGGGV
ncbi:hypothetical protein [Streptomyces lonarensis]|uniref:Integral membrane protein n=1 Tax=Streptomyces lonarensis TaxID=700599 RepID=A0A7X6D1B8_9ACTN|nr:hypothetical protein [Streptomyces lonarensis]NJQ06250.1 hypothetical protein [Streptomyces lonarensis]